MVEKLSSPGVDELEALRRENTRLRAAEAERDRAEAALRESEKRYRHLVEEAGDIIYRTDKGGRFTFFNPTAIKLLGYAEEEIRGRLYLDLIHPDYRRETKHFYVRQLQERIPNTYYEYPALARDGREIWLGQNVQLVVEDGVIVGLQAVARDITKRRKAEIRLQQAYADLEQRVEARTGELRATNEALQRAADRQQRLMQIAAAANASLELDAILRLVRDAVIQEGNVDRAGVFLVEDGQIRGSWGTDLQGHLRDEHAFVERLSEWGPYMDDLVAGRRKFVIEYLPTQKTPEGEEEGPVLHAIVPMRTGGEMVGLIAVDNVISGRPVGEENLTPLLTFAEQAAVAIRNARLLDERARHLDRQRRLARLAAAISARTALNDILRMVRDAVVEAGGFDRAGVFLYDRDNDFLQGTWGTDRSGQPENLSDLQIPMRADAHMPLQRVALGEIEHYRTADFTQEIGLSPDDPMTGVHAHAIVPLRAGETIVGVLCVDNLLRDAPISEQDIDGLFPFAEQAAVAIQNARLFEELCQAQEALVRSEKLRAVGELASGVAHNVNNVLAATLGYAELIQTSEEATPEIKTYARTIERAAMDGAEIVRRMQHFARTESVQEKNVFDLAGVAREAVDLTRPAWLNQASARGAKIEVVTQFASGLWVQGSASEIKEVVVNLIKNAADAMPQGGTLTVRCFVEGGEGVLTVADTGVGMDEATRRKVFEPFFTTKGVGLGTGLGLSVAWGIVDRHNGRMEVQSAPNRGSVFSIWLPLAGFGSVGVGHGDGEASLAGVRLLLVEDEELVQSGIARMLAARGATLFLAADGAEACHWLDTNAGRCDLIVSDHGMVGMTGIELLSQIRLRWPHIRRVLISGWGADLPGGVDVSAAELILVKPTRNDALVDALAKLLATPCECVADG